MLTANEQGLLLDVQGLRISLAAKARVQESMTIDERELITNASEALLELERFYKNGKVRTTAREKKFLAHDHSGRSAKPYQLSEEHIRNTWDMEDINENGDGEETLEDYLDNCEPGDKFENGAEELECIE